MNNFDDYQEKLKTVKLDPSRKNLKPRLPGLTEEQYITLCIKEGNELLEAEGSRSVKAPSPSPVLEDALAKMSSNPYVRARIAILTKMNPTDRSMIEKMNKGEIPKDHRWDAFMAAVSKLGEKYYLSN